MVVWAKTRRFGQDKWETECRKEEIRLLQRELSKYLRGRKENSKNRDTEIIEQYRRICESRKFPLLYFALIFLFFFQETSYMASLSLPLTLLLLVVCDGNLDSENCMSAKLPESKIERAVGRCPIGARSLWCVRPEINLSQVSEHRIKLGSITSSVWGHKQTEK